MKKSAKLSILFKILLNNFITFDISQIIEQFNFILFF